MRPFLWISPSLHRIVTIRICGSFLRALVWAVIIIAMLAVILLANR